MLPAIWFVTNVKPFTELLWSVNLVVMSSWYLTSGKSIRFWTVIY